MSQHKDEVRFRQMLDHAREAMAMIQGKERLDLYSDRMLELSLIRLVEIIGEAAAASEPRVKKNILQFPGFKLSEYATGLFTDTMLSIWTYSGTTLSMISLH